MRCADGRVPFDHPEGLPAALLLYRFKVDSGHDALARPMVAPVVHMKIGDAGAAAGRGVSLLDRTSAWNFVLTWIGVGNAELGKEHSAFFRRSARHPQTMQCRPRVLVHGHGTRFAGLALGNED